MTRSETDVGDRLKAMEEGRRLDDIKMRHPKASRRPTFLAQPPRGKTFRVKNDNLETEAEEMNFDLVANRKKLRYTEGTEFVMGVWGDGRIGTFRGLRSGKKDYGALVYGSKGIVPSGRFTGYGELVTEIVKFFETGKVPIPPEETIEMFAFMSAADESKAKGGAAVTIKSVMEAAHKKNQARLGKKKD